MINITKHLASKGLTLDEYLPQERVQEALREIARCGYIDREFYAKFFFPNTFDAPFNGMHMQILAWLKRPSKYKVLAAPRGLGKTTLAKILMGSFKIAYRQARFMVYITNNGDNAIEQTDDLKNTMMSSPAFRRVFGAITTQDVEIEGIEPTFSKKVWQAFDTIVLPRGRGQQIRGLLYKSKRPDFFLIDDLEIRDMMGSDEYRKKTREWFKSDVMKAISRYDKDFQFIYIDTLKHEDSLLQRLIDDPMWDALVLTACTEDFKATTPEFMDQEEIDREYASHEKNGELDIFCQEYMNQPISKKDAVFQDKYFKHCVFTGTGWYIVTKQDDFVAQTEEDKQVVAETTRIHVSHGVQFIQAHDAEYISREDCVFVVICDPAKTKNLKSADSGLVCFAIHRSQQRLILVEDRSGKMAPDELYDNMFEMCVYWNARILGVEVTSLHLFITQPIRNEIQVRGLTVEFIELTAQGDKLDRIKELSIYYRRGWFYHDVEHRRKIEAQLRMFPRSALVDVCDAAAYILKLMNIAMMYFLPESMDDETLYEAAYDELEKLYQEPINYRRRI